MPDRLQSGREAFSRQAWTIAYEALTEAPPGELDGADLERRAVAAYMIGTDEDSAAAWEAAHRQHMETADAAEAARCAFWLSLCLLLKGQVAQAGGWLSR